MKKSDAAAILDLSGQITPEIVKKAFRMAAKKYHPDLNPAGADMMQVVNAAYAELKDFTGSIDEENAGYPEILNTALNAIFGLDGLEIEVCGAWVWVGGQTRKHKDVLKGAGFRYASKKIKWYFRPADWKSKSRGAFSMDEIRDQYGSTKPNYSNKRPALFQEYA
ncbi:J domain-containing protein [Kiloniella laminariae]|uniref:J domain-containing protein n=1 Tax=Kiloniella laminariae TaxID=454162 RepID=A0ABT4LQ35_9PROT|nr:J domain-containing protein [Kiloniella laminariae]MCZ4283146.1 J domain-containing protein [Kiloniella laminariae]